MAKNESDAGAVQPQVVKWDTETREDVAAKEGHIRDNLMFLTAALLSWMETVWGGVVTFIKTATIEDSGEVWVVKAHKDEPGATYLRRMGAQNAGDFSFWRPLHKLNLRVPPNRQFNVTPFTREVPGVGTVFVFPMNERVSVPRNRKEEKEAEEAAKQAAENASKQTAEKTAKQTAEQAAPTAEG